MTSGRSAGSGHVSARQAAANARVAAAAQASALAAIGLRRGEGVRFRRADRARWQTGTVSRLERDGSIGITDDNGAARAVMIADILVQVRPRRRPDAPLRWEPLADRAARAEQLTLL